MKPWTLMGETITFTDRLKMASFVMTADRFTNGKKVKEFEAEWNKWLGSYHSLYVSSGSTANFLLFAAIKERYGLKNGDKVLVPGCTWMTSVAPIIQLGLQPIFCDINLHNFSFDLNEVKFIAKKHPDIKVIFVTHLLGFSGENERLKEIFPKALLLEDICESHGCRRSDVENSKRGAVSLGATFSFYFGHHMSTIEGGMVSTYSEDLYDLMKMKRSHGLARESINSVVHGAKYRAIDPQFLFMTDGYNFRNHEICAVLGLSQLKRLDDMIHQRRINYDAFVNMIDHHDSLFEIHPYQPGNSSFCFPFICRTSAIMNRMKEIFKKNKIEYRPIVAGNLLRQPFLREYSLTTSKEFTNLDAVHARGVYIGNNHFVKVKQVQELHDIITEEFIK